MELKVTLDEVQKAIEELNGRGLAKLSTKNPANFFKDFVRSCTSANRNWPARVFEAGWTGDQVTGKGDCFAFRPKGDRTLPFLCAQPSEALLATEPTRVESLSLPLASRSLGRTDESWLIQVIVRLRVVELHFATTRADALQLDHLQTSVKLAKSEIDAVYLLQVGQKPADATPYFVTLEAKGRNDDILFDQIIAQVQALAGAWGDACHPLIPMAVKAVGPSLLYVAEFAGVAPDEVASLTSLAIAAESMLSIAPQVPGIGQ